MRMQIDGTETTSRSVRTVVTHYAALEAISYAVFRSYILSGDEDMYIKDGGFFKDTSKAHDRERSFERIRDATPDEIAAYESIKRLNAVFNNMDKNNGA